jgi:hypothetical protein
MKTCITPSIQILAALAVASVTVSGCRSASSHLAAVRDNPVDRLSVGTVQKDLRNGMSGADVIGLLGAPNIVTTDEQRREVWVYDKISTEVAHSSSSLGASPLLLGSGGHFAGALSGNMAQSAGATSRQDRTLTVFVKFYHQKQERDIAYRTSEF